MKDAQAVHIHWHQIHDGTNVKPSTPPKSSGQRSNSRFLAPLRYLNRRLMVVLATGVR